MPCQKKRVCHPQIYGNVSFLVEDQCHNSLQLDIAPAKYFYHGIQFKSLKVDTKMLFHVDIPHIFFFLWGIIPSTIRINI